VSVCVSVLTWIEGTFGLHLLAVCSDMSGTPETGFAWDPAVIMLLGYEIHCYHVSACYTNVYCDSTPLHVLRHHLYQIS
jgi:hypothetical protein